MGTWVAILLLIIAVAVRGLAITRKRDPWPWLAGVARLGAWIALASSILVTTAAPALWSAFNIQLLVQSLVLAIWAIDWVLSWRFRPVVIVPVVDLITLILIVAGAFGIQPSDFSSPCLQSFPLLVWQWLLFVIGTGAAIVAGGNALTLTIDAALADRLGQLPQFGRAALYVAAWEANQLTLAALGSGLVLGLGWAWYQGDPRVLWMTSAWLTAAMAFTALSLSRDRERWSAFLIILTAPVALLSLLATPGLHP